MFDKWFGHKDPFAKHADQQAQDGAYELVGTQRWVVLDTETTGLNIRHDRIISIAALAVHIEPDLSDAHIPLVDTFEAVIHQEHPKTKKDNILIHHIGVGEQGQGHAQADVLGWFEQWLGNSPIFAYHAPFDKAMLEHAMKACGMRALANRWVDVQPLANWSVRETYPLGLDECVARFGLESISRHSAASDTFVTAELLLRLLPQIREVAQDFSQLEQLASQNTMRAY
jgi:DNA polymerase-3 subunit epsilon